MFRPPRRASAILSLASAVALSTAFLSGPQAVGQDGDPILDPLPDPTTSNLALTLEEFAQLPESEPDPPTGDRRLERHNRINYLGEIPDGSGRLYVPDLNGKMYLIDDGDPVEYLDVGAQFLPQFWNHAGLGSGFGFVAFHPEFAENGKFYTVHTEGRELEGRTPDLPHWPDIQRHTIITEWTADDPAANTFGGEHREVLRLGMRTNIHGMQQIDFNPTARPGDEDYGLLYIGMGDGGGATFTNLPQDTSRAEGSILRIDPLGSNSSNGQYGIPASNPFVDDPDALDEIYAYGVRNPHRFSWDPAPPHRMYLGNIGEWHIESIYEVRAGDNFGWTEREGPFVKGDDRWPRPLPDDDDQFGYTYPVAAYDHNRQPGQTGDLGVAVVGGFAYRGEIRQLKGMYVFGNIVTGKIYFTHASQMRQERDEMAPIHEFQLLDAAGRRVTMQDLTGKSRIDLRFGQDADGELYVLSKGSGSIWKITDAKRIPSRDPHEKVVTDVMKQDDWSPVTPEKWAFPGTEVVLAEPGEQRPGPRRPGEYAVLTAGPEWSAVDLNAEVRVDVPTPVGRDVLIVFGYQSDTEFYYAHLSEDTGNYVHNGIFVVNNADRLRIDDQWDGTTSAPAAIAPGMNWHQVRLTHTPGTGKIRLYMDGSDTPLMTATDHTFSSGRVGFGSFDDIGRIRDLTVSGIPAD